MTKVCDLSVLLLTTKKDVIKFLLQLKYKVIPLVKSGFVSSAISSIHTKVVCLDLSVVLTRKKRGKFDAVSVPRGNEK